MDSYKIVVTTDAIADLVELRKYIADVLLSPDIALKYVRMIRKEIASLQTLKSCYGCFDIINKNDVYEYKSVFVGLTGLGICRNNFRFLEEIAAGGIFYANDM